MWMSAALPFRCDESGDEFLSDLLCSLHRTPDVMCMGVPINFLTRSNASTSSMSMPSAPQLQVQANSLRLKFSVKSPINHTPYCNYVTLLLTGASTQSVSLASVGASSFVFSSSSSTIASHGVLGFSSKVFPGLSNMDSCLFWGSHSSAKSR